MGGVRTCFSRTSRIIKAEDFQKVKRDGVAVRTKALIASCLSKQGKRLGIVVSKRVGNAVQRNRLKRITREFFRLNRNSFPAGDNVVVMMPCATDLKNSEVRSSLLCALEKLAAKIG